jgi:molybdate transport system ATP-binding protein
MTLEVALRKRRGEFALDAAFAIQDPGIVALFGRSGCGKTTLVDLLAGLLEPDEGSVCLSGTTLVDTRAAVDLPAERRRIGYVFQDARLFPHRDVEGNLRYGLQRAGAANALIPFDEVVALLGLAPLLGRRPSQLSGGERQRVAIGRALLAQPRLMLLDEPLASLDAARRDEVLPYLERLRDRLAIPIVYVSHQFDEVLRLATHLVLMDAGRVLASGPLSTVSLDPALRSIVGPDAIGAVLEGEVVGREEESGIARLRVGGGELRVVSEEPPGRRLRVQLLARDLILALGDPTGLSVRNSLAATVVGIRPDDPHTDLVQLDIGGPQVVARVTRAATRELGLRAGLALRVLVKSVSMRGQSLPVLGARA